MRILVIGGGGREHALAWKLAQSGRVTELLVAPGNAGTASIAENVAVAATDIDGLVRLASKRHVDLAVVGPEIPLAMGLVDRLNEADIPAFGPTREATRLESSKSFAHEIMTQCGVPCAVARVFTEVVVARDYVRGLVPPFVIKADGLAAGKGAIIVGTHGEADQALNDILVRRVFGEAGNRVVIEEFLPGREVSLLAFTDGTNVSAMVPSCDYKRAYDGDQGPNTGGMGCYSPPGFFDQKMVDMATTTIIQPVVRAMADAGHPFRGVLYAGLMVSDKTIHVLEFNARFGDPETQAILPRLQTDLAEVLQACVTGSLASESLQWMPGCSVDVVLASGGYPGHYEKGHSVIGLDRLGPEVAAFHAGTRLSTDGHVMTDGGRVLSIVATGSTMAEAREKAYAGVARVSFAGMMYRTDIALREVS